MEVRTIANEIAVLNDLHFIGVENIQRLKEAASEEYYNEFGTRFCVEKVFGLTDQEYAEFNDDYLAGYPFLINNTNLMNAGDGVYHCCLVKSIHQKEGVLVVQPSPSLKPKAAYMEDTARIPNLDNVPMELSRAAQKEKPRITQAVFHSGITDIEQWTEEGEKIPFQVNKLAVLNDDDFEVFLKNIGEPYTFLYDNHEFMKQDGDKKQCILVAPYEEGVNAVLVSGDEYAYISDLTLVDTNDARIEYHSLKQYVKTEPDYTPEDDKITRAKFTNEAGDIEKMTWAADLPERDFDIVKDIQIPVPSFQELKKNINLYHSYILDNFELINNNHSVNQPLPCILVSNNDGPDNRNGLLFSFDSAAGELLTAKTDNVSMLNLEGIPTETQQEWLCSGNFIQTPLTMDEVMENPASSVVGMEVERVVQLTKEQFDVFADNLLRPYDFIYHHARDSYYDPEKKQLHCLLVKTVGYGDGLAVYPNSRNRIELAAYIPDVYRLRVMNREDKQFFSKEAMYRNNHRTKWKKRGSQER